MKHVKMLALAAVAAGALMALIGAGSASATVLCSTTVEPCPAGQKWGAVTLDFSIPSGGNAVLKETSAPNGEGKELDKCTTSTVEGNITNTGSSTTTVTGSFATPLETTGLTWGGCTFTTKTISASGSLEVHKIAGTSNGTVTGDSEIRVTINIPIFGSCVYGVTAGTSVGTITEGNPSTFDANAVASKLSGSAFTCPSTSLWTGTYTQTTPSGTTLSVGTS